MSSSCCFENGMAKWRMKKSEMKFSKICSCSAWGIFEQKNIWRKSIFVFQVNVSCFSILLCSVPCLLFFNFCCSKKNNFSSFWFFPVESLIYWRDVKKSGIVFGAGLVILLAISCFSVISVFAYLSLLTLAGTIAFRIYKNVLGAIQKTSEGHPFK